MYTLAWQILQSFLPHSVRAGWSHLQNLRRCLTAINKSLDFTNSCPSAPFNYDRSFQRHGKKQKEARLFLHSLKLGGQSQVKCHGSNNLSCGETIFFIQFNDVGGSSKFHWNKFFPLLWRQILENQRMLLYLVLVEGKSRATNQLIIAPRHISQVFRHSLQILNETLCPRTILFGIRREFLWE